MESLSDERWVYPLSNYYLRLFCKTALGILREMEAKHRIDALLICCENSLRVYDLDEEINICFMQGLLSAGRSADALRHYSHITRKMREELNVHPSPKMKELYKHIQPTQEDSPAPGALDVFTHENLKHILRNYLAPDTADVSVAVINLCAQCTRQAYCGMKVVLHNALRKSDLLAEMPPGAFFVILHGAGKESRDHIIERIRDNFRKCNPGAEVNVDIRFLSIQRPVGMVDTLPNSANSYDNVMQIHRICNGSMINCD